MEATVKKRGRPQKRTAISANDLDSAATLLRGHEMSGCEMFGFTGGQFSLIELLDAVLERIGPAHCKLSVWTAHQADARDAFVWLESGRLKSLRLLVDRSFEGRQPEYCAEVRRLFGDEAIRTTNIHAKFATLRNDNFDIAVRASMNINRNTRIEQFELSDDAAFCDYLDAIIDEVFSASPEYDRSADVVQDGMDRALT